jgi:uncharacterized protein (TIGR03067 family)
MRRLAGLLPLLSVLSLAAARPDAVARELERLEGTWEVRFIEADGQKVPPDVYKDFKLIFKGSSFATVRDGEQRQGSIRIDPLKKPATMDILLERGPDSGKVQLAIYALEGDSLRICGAQPGLDRPRDFETRGKKGVTLLILRRQRD